MDLFFPHKVSFEKHPSVHTQSKRSDTSFQFGSNHDPGEAWIFVTNSHISGELRYFGRGWFVRIVFVREWDEASAFSTENIFLLSNGYLCHFRVGMIFSLK